MSSAGGTLTPEERKVLRANITTKITIDGERYLRNHPEVRDVLSYAVEQVMASRSDEPVRQLERFLATEDLPALSARLKKIAPM
jgi:hypothetical protein